MSVLQRVRREVHRWGVAGAAVLTALLCATSIGNAQDADVPPALQASLFLKVLTFDRNLTSRTGGELVIAIAYQSGNRSSMITKEQIGGALKQRRATGGDRSVRVVAIDLDHESLGAALARERVYALYVAPLRAIDIGDLAATCRAAHVTTLTGVERYVTLGVAVGVRLEGDRPRLLVNIQQARMEGADFSAELLKLAKVVR